MASSLGGVAAAGAASDGAAAPAAAVCAWALLSTSRSPRPGRRREMRKLMDRYIITEEGLRAVVARARGTRRRQIGGLGARGVRGGTTWRRWKEKGAQRGALSASSTGSHTSLQTSRTQNVSFGFGHTEQLWIRARGQ